MCWCTGTFASVDFRKQNAINARLFRSDKKHKGTKKKCKLKHFEYGFNGENGTDEMGTTIIFIFGKSDKDTDHVDGRIEWEKIPLTNLMISSDEKRCNKIHDFHQAWLQTDSKRMIHSFQTSYMYHCNCARINVVAFLVRHLKPIQICVTRKLWYTIGFVTKYIQNYKIIKLAHMLINSSGRALWMAQ